MKAPLGSYTLTMKGCEFEHRSPAEPEDLGGDGDRRADSSWATNQVSPSGNRRYNLILNGWDLELEATCWGSLLNTKCGLVCEPRWQDGEGAGKRTGNIQPLCLQDVPVLRELWWRLPALQSQPVCQNESELHPGTPRRNTHPIFCDYKVPGLIPAEDICSKSFPSSLPFDSILPPGGAATRQYI